MAAPAPQSAEAEPEGQALARFISLVATVPLLERRSAAEEAAAPELAAEATMVVPPAPAELPQPVEAPAGQGLAAATAGTELVQVEAPVDRLAPARQITAATAPADK